MTTTSKTPPLWLFVLAFCELLRTASASIETLPEGILHSLVQPLRIHFRDNFLLINPSKVQRDAILSFHSTIEIIFLVVGAFIILVIFCTVFLIYNPTKNHKLTTMHAQIMFILNAPFIFVLLSLISVSNLLPENAVHLFRIGALAKFIGDFYGILEAFCCYDKDTGVFLPKVETTTLVKKQTVKFWGNLSEKEHPDSVTGLSAFLKVDVSDKGRADAFLDRNKKWCSFTGNAMVICKFAIFFIPFNTRLVPFILTCFSTLFAIMSLHYLRLYRNAIINRLSAISGGNRLKTWAFILFFFLIILQEFFISFLSFISKNWEWTSVYVADRPKFFESWNALAICLECAFLWMIFLTQVKSGVWGIEKSTHHNKSEYADRNTTVELQPLSRSGDVQESGKSSNKKKKAKDRGDDDDDDDDDDGHHHREGGRDKENKKDKDKEKEKEKDKDKEKEKEKDKNKNKKKEKEVKETIRKIEEEADSLNQSHDAPIDIGVNNLRRGGEY